MASEGERFITACREQRWDEVSETIRRSPWLIWTSRDSFGNPAFLVAYYGNARILQEMLTAVFSTPRQFHKQRFRDAFEHPHFYTGNRPVDVAALFGHMKVLKLLMKYAPNGAAILETKNEYGWTTAHLAAMGGKQRMLKFILTHAPSGLNILNMRDRFGRTALDRGTLRIKRIFTTKKIRLIALQNELSLIPCLKRTANGYDEALPSLMLEVVRQNTEVHIHRNKK